MSDLHADEESLAEIARAVRSAADRVGGLAAALPAAPDAGDAAPIVDTLLANLLTGAAELAETAVGLWSGVEESRAAYREVENAVAGALDRLAARGAR